jgi:hypothetical protein
MYMPIGRDSRLREVLENDQTYSTSLMAVLIDVYGMETATQDWEPEVLADELMTRFSARIPKVNVDKIQAMLTILTTDLFYIDPIVFNGVCQALNNEESDFAIFNPISCEGVAWGITEATLNDPDPEATYSDEVSRYIGVLIEERGLVFPPNILKSVATLLPSQGDINEYADDPRVYEALVQVQKANSASIEEYVEKRTADLFRELEGLPLSMPVDMKNFRIAPEQG